MPNKKNDAIDLYPYLVYAPDADAIASEGGGGGSLDIGGMVSLAVNLNSEALETAIVGIYYEDDVLAFCTSSNAQMVTGTHIYVTDEDLPSTATATLKIADGEATPLTVELFEDFESYGVQFDLPTTIPARTTVFVNFTSL